MISAIKTYILNLFDLLFTYHALNNGAVELNPLMQSMSTQIIFKVFVVGALCALLAWAAKTGLKVAKYGLIITAIAYATVNVWHISNLLMAWIF